MSRELRLYVPDMPIMLAQKLINERYMRIMEYRPWAGLRKTSQFLIPDAYTTGGVTAIYGSATYTGVGTAWTSDMVGRQIKVSNQAPIQTILTVDVGAQTLTTAEVWGLPDVTAGGYTIAQNYVTVPEDFKRFLVIADPLRQWKLFFNVKNTELNIYDPARTNVGDPWLVADLGYTSTGRIQYELWPGPQTKRVFPYTYYAQATELIDPDDEPIFPLRGEEIVLGALADACQWPGTPDRPNPLFLQCATQMPLFEAKFTNAMNNIERQDEEIYVTWWGQDDINGYPYAPFDDKFLQNHAYMQ